MKNSLISSKSTSCLSLDISSSSSVSPISSRLSVPRNFGRDEFTLNTLRFSSIGIHGREEEIYQLNRAFDRIRGDDNSDLIKSKEEEDDIPTIMGGNSLIYGGWSSPGSSDSEDEIKIKVEYQHGKYDDNIKDRIGRKRGMELLLLSGNSGTGKTALAHAFEKPTKMCGGFFAFGKFDFQRRSEPYTAFNSAFVQICDEILELKKRNSVKYEGIKRSIQEAVGCEIDILANTIIPNINLIINENNADGEEIKPNDPHFQNQQHPEDEEIYDEIMADKSKNLNKSKNKNNKNKNKKRKAVPHNSLLDMEEGTTTSTKNKFSYIIGKFLRAICDTIPFLVLVMDDLQWADVPSLDLIESILTDEENSGVMFVGCYRDNEVDCDTHHPLLSRLRRIEINGIIEEEEEKDVDDENTNLCNNEIKKPKNATPTPSKLLRITKINVGNLSVESINSLLQDLFPSNKERTFTLAQIIHKKTQGNIFFVIEFLRSLKDSGMISYSFISLRWDWDENQIELETNVTENVAALMANKMSKLLSDDDKEIIVIAACLGATFEFSTLLLVALKILVERKGERQHHLVALDVLSSLSVCVSEDLLLEDDRRIIRKSYCNIGASNGENGLMTNKEEMVPHPPPSFPESYRFVHDQVQQAAMSLVSEKRQTQLQFRIGEILVDSLTGASFEKNLFVVVNLLNRGSGYIIDNTRTETHKESDPTIDENSATVTRNDLARLNLQAGKKAMELSAFVTSSMYLRKGIELLDQDCWENENDEIAVVAIDLLSSAAQAEYCNGNFAGMQTYLDKILTQTEFSFKTKIRAYLTLLESLRAQEEHMKGIEMSLYLLSQLGIKFPKRHFKLAIITQLLKTKLLLHKHAESLLQLPIMNNKDSTEKMAMKIMDGLATCAYLTKSDLLPLAIFKMVQYSIRYGLSQYSPVAFTCYGMILCILGEFKMGYEIGKLGVALLDRVGVREPHSRVLAIFYTYVSPWTTPVATSAKPLLEGYQIGMETGDLENAMLNLWGYMWCALNSGQNLIALEDDMRQYNKKMIYYKQECIRIGCVVPWQYVLNLVGKSGGDPTILTGEAMNQNQLLRHLGNTGNDIAIDLVKMTSMDLAFYFGKYELAWELAESGKDYLKTNPAHPVVWRSTFVRGLTALSLAHKKRTNRRKWIIQATKCFKTLKKWASRGNVNCVHVIYLLGAEEAYLKGKEDEAREKYNEAITAAARAGFVRDKALANERAGEFFLACGNKNQASFYFNTAYQLYTDWGAAAKAEQLNQKHTF